MRQINLSLQTSASGHFGLAPSDDESGCGEGVKFCHFYVDVFCGQVLRSVLLIDMAAVTNGSLSVGVIGDTSAQNQSSSSCTIAPVDGLSDSTNASSGAIGSHRLPARLVANAVPHFCVELLYPL